MNTKMNGNATDVQPRERPILFSGPMIRAVLSGAKTQTRRLLAPQTEHGAGPCHWSPTGWANTDAPRNERGDQGCTCKPVRCPYGHPGDRLWVRETWAKAGEIGDVAEYRADNGDPLAGKWRPSIFMPRWASRISLDVTSVRVERLHNITEEDARAEGVAPHPTTGECADQFSMLWDSINGKRAAWSSNPWVWVVGFRRAEATR